MKTPGSLPVYVQISEMLIREISAGHLLAGDRFPPERIMAREMGVSVGTLRKALAELERKGLLERRQGSGNYVRANGKAEGVYAFFRIELLQGGGLPTARVLEIDRLTKPADLPEFGASREAHRIRRIRFLNQSSVALEEIWLDGDWAERLMASELSDSLYLYYKRRLGLWITSAADSVGLSTIPEWAPHEFQLAPGTPCGFVERTSWSQENKPAECSRTWFDTSIARYVARIK
ncbi:MAG: GntR family transcriptional regulator [Paracoccaceae bacterium]